jgi:DNA-binding NarL/FixJ family response regulator
VTRRDPAATDWAKRVFRNTYTRSGRRIVLAGWSIKIQHQGRRHTFSLPGRSRKLAALEAKAIYDTIRAEGWDAALGNRPRRGRPAEVYPRSDVRYWKERLLLRRYRFAPSGETGQDLAVRIDHAGTGYFFPLGTSNAASAAAKAHAIYWTAVKRGWDVVCSSHTRELIVGFEWSSNPVMWTYTTIHTLVARRAAAASDGNRADLRRVMVVESDVGVRRALAWCLNQQPGIFCVTCDSAESFAHDFAVHRPHMVMLNRNLAGRLGFNSPGQIAVLHQSVPGLTYSTCVDGDQLFVSTPGGSEGYLLKRVKPARLLEPILNEAGLPKFSTSDLQERVKAYFKTLLPTRSDHDPSALARLTRREREVLDLLSKGCVDKEIAQALGISAWTVHDHIKNIFDRLRVRTRTEAVVRYLEK